MSHACTEDQLAEQPAIGLFAALGWQTVSTRVLVRVLCGANRHHLDIVIARVLE